MINKNILKYKTDIQKYLSIVHEFDGVIDFEENKKYLDILPEYLVARCPVCNAKYSELLDTYTLRKILRPTSGKSIFRPEAVTTRCSHFVIAQYFVNLNGYIPEISLTELRTGKRFNSEVPHVMPMLFDQKIESYAVMHSLPICRIEEDRFVPRYTLYMITYYTQEEHKETLLDRLRHWEPELENFELLAFPLPEYGEATEWWDLKQWVDKGKLFWLEPDNPDLPLIKGPVGKFPYGDITGRKEPYFETVPPRRKKKLFGLFGG